MTEKRTFFQRLANRFFAIPNVLQWWAKRSAGRINALVDIPTAIPFARVRKPLRTARVALLTTAGVHLRDQPPFDMQNPDGDPTYREIPGTVEVGDLMITHKYYDHTDADADLNVVFPLAHFRNLVQQGVIGNLAPRHFGFMGHIDQAEVARLTAESVPEVVAKLRADGVDFAFLTPA